ncbi:MAG: hypothetical protein ACXVCV_11540 [Polyangia bacterium]
MSAEPDHPILSQPWTYDLIGFELRFHDGEPYVDLTFKRGQEVRRLRFLRPRDLVLREAARGPEGGLRYGLSIKDVSARGVEDVRIEVAGSEPGPGELHFLAADVLLLEPTAARTDT